MKRTSKIPLQTDALKGPGWLIFFYSVPSKPVNNRVKIWRRLAKAGAISLKGAVYMLPYSEENFEFFTWLSSEVVSIGGEGAFVMADKIETMKNDEIIRLFNQQRERDYHTIEKGLEDLERRINSIRKGTGIQNNKLLLERFNKHLKEFGEIKKIDFFSSKTGNVLKSRIEVIRAGIRGIAGTDIRKQQVAVVPKQIKDYQGRIWVTRKNPFVDRMASAWLI
ncbi:MAG: hypothetical protein HZC12_03685, partial [Nitrospirae bacterium]|nr:hypothetical protein [Nitrospirota bacterium]